MDYREAIDVLKSGRKIKDNIPHLIDAYEMAISAMEKQIEMKNYCDEMGCAKCPYRNPHTTDNRCMNEFIVDWSDFYE